MVSLLCFGITRHAREFLGTLVNYYQGQYELLKRIVSRDPSNSRFNLLQNILIADTTRKRSVYN